MPDRKSRKRLTKTCATCGRPFAWRKKWQGCWDDVRYCSQRCRREKKPVRGSSGTS